MRPDPISSQRQTGEVAAAALTRELGGTVETARDLTCRLYSICERKKWADEPLAYNGLVIAWPGLTKFALADRSKGTKTQKGSDGSLDLRAAAVTGWKPGGTIRTLAIIKLRTTGT